MESWLEKIFLELQRGRMNSGRTIPAGSASCRVNFLISGNVSNRPFRWMHSHIYPSYRADNSCHPSIHPCVHPATSGIIQFVVRLFFFLSRKMFPHFSRLNSRSKVEISSTLPDSWLRNSSAFRFDWNRFTLHWIDSGAVKWFLIAEALGFHPESFHQFSTCGIITSGFFSIRKNFFLAVPDWFGWIRITLKRIHS